MATFLFYTFKTATAHANRAQFILQLTPRVMTDLRSLRFLTKSRKSDARLTPTSLGLYTNITLYTTNVQLYSYCAKVEKYSDIMELDSTENRTQLTDFVYFALITTLMKAKTVSSSGVNF